jgi:hypothetical protein
LPSLRVHAGVFFGVALAIKHRSGY